MALKMDISLPSGLEINGAYIMIQNVTGNKNILYLTVNVYISELARREERPPLETRNYAFVPDQKENSLRWDKQGYLHMKSFPEYENAVDVFEV